MTPYKLPTSDAVALEAVDLIAGLEIVDLIAALETVGLIVDLKAADLVVRALRSLNITINL